MRFTPLSEKADYTFPAGAFDVRGWEVRTLADEEKVGQVDDVLIDEAGKVRYLDIDLGLFRKHVLLPVGQARIDEKDDVIWVPGMTKEQFREIPAYAHDVGRVTRDYEDRLVAAYTGMYEGPGEGVDEGQALEEAPEDLGEGRLASLGDLPGYGVAADDPDPRGWEVIASDGRTIGEVHELIVDTAALKVRYLDCDVDEEALGLDEQDRHILIPIGYARLDQEAEGVIVDVLSSSDIRSLPSFDGLPISPEYESRVRQRYSQGIAGDGYYEHPLFDASRLYGTRAGPWPGDVERSD